ncbi:MAG: Bax inhibitor-1/YccA family protein [Pyrinomonadaceae bacterium]
MNTYTNTYGNYPAAQALPEERAAFIRKTYTHLAGAIAAFVLLEAFLISSGLGGLIAQTLVSFGSLGWFVVLALFIGVSTVATSWANSQSSKGMQYAGLALYTVAEAIIFLPLIIFATYATSDKYLIYEAGISTLGLFFGITAVVFLTRKDFSFLGPILTIGGFIALGFIAVNLLFGFSLGNVFAFAMVAFAGGAILYQTSNILHQYRTDQHVAAALALFASVALLFWYILRIFSSRR